MRWEQWVFAYLAAMNGVTFVLMALDKKRARHRRRRRVKERTLFFLTIAGGALGTWLGMARFRHKTKHASFQIVAPTFTVLWILLVMWMLDVGIFGR